ncbi:MAG: hypothetical protein KKG93_17810 [Bacteroidetes bacterium]|nr:hypothetical protein [Bacteroidota bacterium]
MKILLKIFIISITLAVAVSAQSFEAFADTDSSEYMVGDYITYTLELRYDNSLQVTIPSIKDSVNSLEFIKELTPQRQESNGKIFEKFFFVFAGYDSAEITIPPFQIASVVKGSNEVFYQKVNPVTITVKTIEVDSEADIMDVKAPLYIQLNWLLIILITIGIIILLLIGYWIYKKYFKKEVVGSKKIIIKLPPHKIALENLYKLEEKKLWQQGLIKEFHTEVTEIVRRYFEDRFKILALEMTSAEVLVNLKYNEESDDISVVTEEFLSNADLVKFAKFKPLASLNESMLKQAFEIVNKTKRGTDEEILEEVANA